MNFLIDLVNYDKVKDYTWRVRKNGNYYYAVASSGKNNVVLQLHRFIMGATKGQIIDHIDRNTLDNRFSNLRFCDKKQNSINCKLYKNSTTGYIGVSKTKNGKYIAYITNKQKHIHLGTFQTKEEAAKKRNIVALTYHGEFAKLNIIKG